MSTALKPIAGDWELQETASIKINENITIKHKTGHGIRYKENIFKHKCNKALKNKLKKYKLRRDGKEDPDVINVSHIFQTTLKLKSPTINNNEELNIYDLERPKNYLFKMVRRKKEVDNVKSIKTLFKELPEKNIPIVIPDVSADVTEKEKQSPNSQDKKHTNAFKLMMESRNKSIGGNSPGKEKPIDEAEEQLKIEEKSTKAKRLLVLQRMAEKKGSLKKKEKEELLEEAIKRKMDKRAERLTNMIVNNGSKKAKPKKVHSQLVTKVTDTKLPKVDNTKVITEKQEITKKGNGALHLINIFDEPTSESNIANGLKEKLVPKEDLEFFKKLSPSIKKKENMLCYFKKIEKDSDSSPQVTDNNEMSPIIKVKFGARNKKKLKKKKLSLNDKTLEIEEKNTITVVTDVEQCSTPTKATNGEVVTDMPEEHKTESVVTNTPKESKNESRKRKREQLSKEENSQIVKNTECLNQSLEENETKNGRPKRNVKKPIQYKDDFILSSSDEEYNIFTPKKKKHSDKKSDTPKSIKESKSKTNDEVTKMKPNNKDNKKPAKNIDANKNTNVKLAPIFAPKPQLDPAALEAKQKFLQSGVPEKLKKIAKQLKQVETDSNCFPTVVHVQQIDDSENDVSSKLIIDSFRCESPDVSPVKCCDKIFQAILSPEKKSKNSQIAQPDNNVRKVLQNIKLSYPKFPVYRTYQYLKEKSKGEFVECNSFPEFDNSVEIMNNTIENNKVQADKLNWTDKYKPMVTSQIIGNFETTKELKKWLESWSSNDDKRKMNGADSDSSDFYHSDTDSRDSVKPIDNLLILNGPTGCGKTSCVYAVAADLAIKVIEVNASSKRNGKIMLQDLQEATQSHKVNRGKSTSAENSQKSQEIVEVDLTIKKKRGRPTKAKAKEVVLAKQKSDPGSQSTNSQENTRTGMSLILIDDADIVFDQDDGFCSAISQLVQYSKRPVILVTSSLVCPHLQRFLQIAKIMTMKPLLPRMLGTWLDILCLADSGTCWPGLGSVLLDLYKGDIRKTINCLQFYATTHTQGTSQMEENSQNIEALCDETSSMSWAGSENQEERNLTCESVQLGDTLWKYFMERQSQLLHIRFPSDLWHVWWNIPSFFMTTQKETDENNKHEQTRKLEEVASIIDNISAADYFGRLRPDAKTNICSQPWYSSECDSSSEFENFNYYNKSYDVADDISKTLVVRSICNTQKCLQYNEELYVRPTSMAVQRDRDRIVKRHDSISTHLSPGATLDRRALALDYWPSCRAICRFEKEKTDTHSKRNNRFCHYLRSLKIMCKNDVFDKLGESLDVKEDDSK
ncbi:ATPase family AAA domain-containing protein 5 [Leguminivora glycinivorella]|uniref:ATPase family AAA domain-containing protein 5 n=1 Tax=Leguminivora glycinivorella TaxID=1035111 RepID=UPI00200E07FC|nr:ATPase family AAA domain-containing protein 5 [Leguminivora glycinivorella]